AFDLDGKRFRDARGDLELGRGIHDADGADVLLLNAAAAANHRQQPACFRILPAADGGAKPDATLRHSVAQRLLGLRSRPVIASSAARRAVVPLPAALAARPATIL